MSFYISRFKGIERREFKVEVVTPLFLGGADPKKAELRAPSIKGALRFWWRASYGSDNLEEMKMRESEIFGSTENKANFSIQLENKPETDSVVADLPPGLKVLTQSKGKNFKISIIDYLAYGLCEYKREKKKNVYTKAHIPVGTKFSIILSFNNQFYKEDILKAFYAFIKYGGLGARSRNGFGSLNLGDAIEDSKFSGTLKTFTAFNEHTKIFDNFKQTAKWEDALSEIGKVYREARSSLEKKHSFVKRQLIAKPLIVKREVSLNDRHAKPYFLHVKKLYNGMYQGQILFMPYNYYNLNKRQEYFETCNLMNQKILELSGGPK